MTGLADALQCCVLVFNYRDVGTSEGNLSTAGQMVDDAAQCLNFLATALEV